ncbi:hypothetical protein [Nonomuraea rubra]|uniref:hypothetical protein n=1 Tax=Nonomuraea rubra TaxID=46180 RepID=UPI0033FB6953
MSNADEIVELIVPARERSCVARALLQAAEQLGLPAEVVQSTSTGYRVPRAVADAADEQLAEAGLDDQVSGTYAAHTPGGRVTYSRDGDEGDEGEPAQGDELPEPVRNRRKGSRS